MSDTGKTPSAAGGDGPFKVLVVDDDDDFRRMCVLTIRAFGHDVDGVASAEEAMETLGSGGFDAVLCDILMPGTSGLQALKLMKAEFPEVEVVMMSGHASVPWAVEAMRNGAADYLVKPFEIEPLRRALSVAARTGGLVRENRLLRRTLDMEFGPHTLIGRSRAMADLRRILRKVSGTDVSVLLLGESGTGKEVVSRAIHWASARRSRPFVPVDCGSMAQGLVESELFGHVKGAFTGAESDREGLIGAADGGTLFLDEIGEMPPEAQVRLLRVLENAELRPVGSTRVRHVDVRVIAATNRDLEKCETFRRDLFYRLNVVKIELPPLRERREDIPLLARHLLDLHRGNGSTCERFSAAAMSAMESHDWPGNVRELDNLVQRACALANGVEIVPSDLPGELLEAARKPCGLKTLEELRKEAILATLAAVGNDRTKAAQVLGIDRSTLYRNMRDLGLSASV